jgi:hypothetical protein
MFYAAFFLGRRNPQIGSIGSNNEIKSCFACSETSVFKFLVCEYLSVVRKEECPIHCFCKSSGVPLFRSMVFPKSNSQVIQTFLPRISFTTPTILKPGLRDAEPLQ